MVTLSNETIVVADSNGINRGYHQVNRPVVVGDRVLVVNAYKSFDNYKNGDVLSVVRVNPCTGGIGVPEINRVKPYLCANEFVVLEPSDIVIIDGERFRTVSRKAKIGERVLATGKDDFDVYEIGDVITIDFVDGPNYVNGPYKDGDVGLRDLTQYVVLEPVAPASTPQSATSATPSVPSTDELLTLVSSLAAQNVKLEKRVVSLEANVADHERFNGAIERTVTRLETQLRVAREDIVLIEEGAGEHITAVEKRVLALESPEIVTSPSTVLAFNDRNPLPTLSRQDVIDRAKADVADRFKTFDNDPPVVDGLHGHNTVEFIVNREKRTVVALLRLAYTGEDRVSGTGKCRCAPDDVFNVNIGKAIALRRALGLDVPSHYTKCPQPTEPQVGDIVTGGETGGSYYNTDKTFTLTAIHGGDSFHYSLTTTDWSKTDWICRSQIGRIVDDSRETLVSP